MSPRRLIFPGLEPLEPRQHLSSSFDLIGLTALRADPLYSSLNGRGVAVAVLDAGIDTTNPSLQPAILTSVDFVNRGTAVSNHGTGVAGAIAARDTAFGIASGAGLINIRVLEDSPTPSPSHIDEGLQWVLDHHTQYNILAVNISLGDGVTRTTANTGGYAPLIRKLEAAGITVISAAGNEYFTRQTPGVSSPGIDSTLVVGAVWPDSATRNATFDDGAKDFTTGPDRLVSFSDRWTGPSYLLAPGANVLSLALNNGRLTENGTSIAAPMVAGSVAIMQDAAQRITGKALPPSDIVRILKSTAKTVFDGDDENDNVTNTNTNYLRIDLQKAVRQIALEYSSVTVGSVTSTLTESISGDSITLTANNATTTFGSVVNMVFYIDFNRNGTLEPAEQIGQDHDGTDGWAFTIAANRWAPGAYQIGAVGLNALDVLSPPTTAVNVLKPALPVSVTYPEGFANESTIDEFVPLVNPNDTAVSYRVIAHYEIGPAGQPLDTIIDEGTIPAQSRGGITITTRGGAGSSLVQLNRGYALEVQSTAPIGAILSHYDNFNPQAADAGVATGEAFTSISARSWYLPSVQRATGTVNDFLIFYNPQDTPQTITAIFSTAGRQAASINFSTRARGRGGLSIADLTQLTDGVYSVVITAPAAITVALSHYSTDGTGDSSLAVPALATSGLSSKGTLALVDRSAGLDATVVLFNPTGNRINVTLIAASDTPSVAAISRTFSVPARSSLNTNLLWGPSDGEHPQSISYSATGSVSVALFQNAQSRGDSVFDPGAVFTSDAWAVADGFLDRATAGVKFFETLSLFNPGTTSVTIAIDFLLYDYRQGLSTDGRSIRQSQSVVVPAGRSFSLPLQSPESTPLSSVGPSQIPYSIVARSSAQFIAAFSHWDLFQGGGWSTIATPLGTVVSL